MEHNEPLLEKDIRVWVSFNYKDASTGNSELYPLKKRSDTRFGLVDGFLTDGPHKGKLVVSSLMKPGINGTKLCLSMGQLEYATDKEIKKIEKAVKEHKAWVDVPL